MDPLTSLLVADLVRERQNDIADQAEAARFRAGVRTRPSIVRRGLARGFALVSRSSAGAVRRLDGCLADDLVNNLTAGHGA